jgi:type II secretory ATPase GspE/PulE/Tfp pilus assembly ATPase PilB-like protein
MDTSAEIRELILRSASADALREAASRAGLRTLAADGRRLVEAGVTTLDEVLSVTSTGEPTDIVEGGPVR